ncbi:MAG TPA: stealth conserved region 3 domain-containing protein [Thermoanaerobaculaceae bacterium]|nr:stealth conserved region 3 domain-containing protein [Thermoanaerobaculaceae bacterium]
MSGPGADENAAVDAVYTWVDGGDAAFRAELGRHRAAAGAAGDAAGAGPDRFRNSGELRYSLRSLLLHAPWVRHIHVLTNGQAPAWLDASTAMVRVVSHREVFGEGGALPSFNSNAIEMHLHRIPGLARRFLYFNDDVFLGGRVEAGDFFLPGGGQRVFVQDTPLPHDRDTGSTRDRSCAYTHALATRLWGQPPSSRLLPAHAPQPYDRDRLARLAMLLDGEFRRTASHRFRAADDLVLAVAYASFLTEAPEEAGRHDRVVLGDPSPEYRLLMLRGNLIAEVRALAAIHRAPPRFFCINDDLGSAGRYHPVLIAMRAALRSSFPRRSPAERPPVAVRTLRGRGRTAGGAVPGPEGHRLAAGVRPGEAVTAPRLSVVVPLFNKRAFVASCLDAIVAAAEEIGGADIVVVDDGSTDGSGELVRSRFPGVEVVSLERSGTPARARNVGAARAGGNVLCFVDADCRVAPDYFAQVERVFVATGACAIGGWVDVPPDAPALVAEWHLRRNPAADGPSRHVDGAVLSVRRTAFAAAGGFDEGLVTGEDSELCARLAALPGGVVRSGRIRAAHLDPPTTFRRFFAGEVWHGLGMFAVPFRSSRDLATTATIAHAVLVALAAACLAAPLSLTARAAAAVVLVGAVPAATVVRRAVATRRLGRPLTALALYECYYAARLVSMLVLAWRSIAGASRGRPAAGEQGRRSP